MSSQKLIEEMKQDGRIVFECVTGSHAYGTNTPDSDLDIRGIFILPKTDVVSLFDPPQEVGDDKQDIKYYELKKFLNLATQCNPNIIELLFPPKETVRIMTPAMEKIIANRHLFMSTRAEVTFSGYAFAQIERARGQNKLVHNPKPEAHPKKEDFCWVIPIRDAYSQSKATGYYMDFSADVELQRQMETTPCRPIPLSRAKLALNQYHAAQLEHVPNTYRLYWYGSAANGVFRGDDMLVCESIPLEDEASRFVGLLIYNEADYEREVRDWKNYWDWVEKRNKSRWIQQERGELDYDAKNLSHCFRLLMSGKNIMLHGEPIVRFDGEALQFLRDVRAGKFAYEQLIERAQREMQELKDLKAKSVLPYACDMHKVDHLYKELQMDWQ